MLPRPPHRLQAWGRTLESLHPRAASRETVRHRSPGWAIHIRCSGRGEAVRQCLRKFCALNGASESRCCANGSLKLAAARLSGRDDLLMLGAQLTATARQVVTAKHAFVFACFRLPRRPERKTRFCIGSMAFQGSGSRFPTLRCAARAAGHN